MEFLGDVLQSTCPSNTYPFLSAQNWHEGQGGGRGQSSSSTGQINLPLPIFSEPNAAPPVGQHGKFQIETRNSHEALRIKSFKNLRSGNISTGLTFLILPKRYLSISIMWYSILRTAMLVSSSKFFVRPHAASHLLEYITRLSILLLLLTMLYKAPLESTFFVNNNTPLVASTSPVS